MDNFAWRTRMNFTSFISYAYRGRFVLSIPVTSHRIQFFELVLQQSRHLGKVAMLLTYWQALVYCWTFQNLSSTNRKLGIYMRYHTLHAFWRCLPLILRLWKLVTCSDLVLTLVNQNPFPTFVNIRCTEDILLLP